MTDQTPLTDQQLDRLDNLAGAATPGPWGTYDDGTGLIDIAAELADTGHGYRCRRYIGQLEADQIDNDPAHRNWTEEQDRAQVAADAAYIAAMPPEVAKTLVAEVRRLQRQRRFLLDQIAKKDARSGEGDRALREFLGGEEQPAEVDRLRAELAAEQAQHRYTLRQRNNRSERLQYLQTLANTGQTALLAEEAKDTLSASINDHLPADGDEMAASLRRDGFGDDEIAEMLARPAAVPAAAEGAER